MATVILVRHGRTTANTSGVLAGRTAGVKLDEHGVEQAVALGERLAQVPLRAVVTSPLERCRATAKEIDRRQDQRPGMTSEKGLVEVDYGEWSGRSLKDLAKEDLWRVVQVHPAGAVFPGGESMAAMSARSVAAVRRWDTRVEAEHGGDATWVAVGHGDIIKAVLADALGMHLDAFQRLVVDPASVSIVRYTAARPFVLMTNSSAGDLSFLRPPKRRRGRRSSRSDAAVGGGVGTRG